MQRSNYKKGARNNIGRILQSNQGEEGGKTKFMISLIIKIPEEMWEKVKNGYVPLGISKYLMKAIPLPKGHGRLIDEDQIPGDDGWDFSDRLMSTQTIIEADEEVKE